MRCPFCNSAGTGVKDSRVADDGSFIKRRRFCNECGARFTTYERIELKELLVKKSSGALELFDREKLLRSIKVACRKRPVSQERIEHIVSAIRRQLETTGEQEINSKEIGSLAIEILSRIDMVAYIRYASVYYNFSSREDFMQFVEAIKEEVVKRAETESADLGVAYDKCAIKPSGSSAPQDKSSDKPPPESPKPPPARPKKDTLF